MSRPITSFMADVVASKLGTGLLGERKKRKREKERKKEEKLYII